MDDLLTIEEMANIASEEKDDIGRFGIRIRNLQDGRTRKVVLKEVGVWLNELLQTTPRGERIATIEVAIGALLCGEMPEG